MGLGITLTPTLLRKFFTTTCGETVGQPTSLWLSQQLDVWRLLCVADIVVYCVVGCWCWHISLWVWDLSFAVWESITQILELWFCKPVTTISQHLDIICIYSTYRHYNCFHIFGFLWNQNFKKKARPDYGQVGQIYQSRLHLMNLGLKQLLLTFSVHSQCQCNCHASWHV